MPERIAVIGTSGSGKTHLAADLGRRLAIPHVELDNLHWQPGWQEAETEEFRSRVSQALARDRWVVCGNYSKARDIIWQRADTVVWLDYVELFAQPEYAHLCVLRFANQRQTDLWLEKLTADLVP